MDGWTLWLIEVLYTIKRDLLVLFGPKEDCMKKNQDLQWSDKKVISFLSLSKTDRQIL